MESAILAAIIQSRKAFETIAGHFDAKRTFTPLGQFWYELVDEYYARDAKAPSVSLTVLRELGATKLGSHKARDTILAVLDNLPADASPANVAASVLGLKRTGLCLELAGHVSGGQSAKADKVFKELSEIWATVDLGPTNDIQQAVPVEDLFAIADPARRIKLLPNALNGRIAGGVLAGQHVGVFGRSEIGKTSFVLNMVAGFIRGKHKVLYIGNEDNINLLKLRALGRLLRKRPDEIQADRARSIARFRELGGEDYLTMLHMSPGTIATIRAAVEAHEPKVVVIDQLRNLANEEDGLTRKMERNAIAFRSMLSEHEIVGISVAQAGDRSSAHNSDSPIWLASGDVDSSRVGWPATTDLLLGLGGNAAMLSRGQRAVSMIKNKISSAAGSREGFICQLDVQTGVVE